MPTSHNLTIIESSGPIKIKTRSGGLFYSASPLTNSTATLTFTLNQFNYISIEFEHDKQTPLRLEIL